MTRSRLTAFLFEIVYTDGRVERVVFYAGSKEAAMRDAEAWAARMGVELEAVEDEHDEEAA